MPLGWERSCLPVPLQRQAIRVLLARRSRLSIFAQPPRRPLTHLESKFADKEKASAVVNQHVPNSGSPSASSIDKPGLVRQLQKMNGMEKKRRSRTWRDQPAADKHKPAKQYQKSNPPPRATSSTTQPASPNPSSRSPSRRKNTSHASNRSYFDTLPPMTSSDEHRSPYSSTTSPSRSSSPPYYLSAGIPLLPEPRNSSPLQASLPIPTPTFDPFRRVGLAPQFAPDCFSPTLPGYHEFQSYNCGLPDESGAQHPVSQAIPVEGSHLATQFNDICGPNLPCWNEHNGRQERIELSAYPRSLASHPPGVLAPRLAHLPEQASSFPPMLHGSDTLPTGNPSNGYPSTNPTTTVSYYS